MLIILILLSLVWLLLVLPFGGMFIATAMTAGAVKAQKRTVATVWLLANLAFIPLVVVCIPATWILYGIGLERAALLASLIPLVDILVFGAAMFLALRQP